MKIVKIMIAVILLCVVSCTGMDVYACSCSWGGPFFKVAPQAEFVIKGKIMSYHGEEKGIKQAMDVEVLEVLKGTCHQKNIRIWGGKGWLCRPDVTQFPVGTEWILGINGPGSKPGIEGGYAISICGQYWLQVVNGVVVGNIDNEQEREFSQELPLEEFKKRFRNGK
ncbi:MAG: hypothetical protein NTX36_11870 [Proteobacteria bacterium]|nr:hypothetical protein [Pseudomonadota bacterium]